MMKRTATLMAKVAFGLVALAAAATLATPAFATVLASDSFTYPNGNLVPNGGWANFSGTGTDLQVTSGRAVGNHANPPDDHLLFPVQPTNTKTYACFDVIIQQPAPGASPKPVYFAMLKDAGTSNFVSRVYVLPISGGWTFGISHASTSNTSNATCGNALGCGVTPWSASTLAYGQKYNVVIDYDPVNHNSTLWVNPASELSTSVSNANALITALAVQGFGLRESATAATLPASPAYTGTADIVYSFDNLGVGTTFADACQQYLSTPAQRSTWGSVKAIYR